MTSELLQPSVGFLIYKWLAFGITMVLLRRRVARAAHDVAG